MAVRKVTVTLDETQVEQIALGQGAFWLNRPGPGRLVEVDETW